MVSLVNSNISAEKAPRVYRRGRVNVECTSSWGCSMVVHKTAPVSGSRGRHTGGLLLFFFFFFFSVVFFLFRSLHERQARDRSGERHDANTIVTSIRIINPRQRRRRSPETDRAAAGRRTRERKSTRRERYLPFSLPVAFDRRVIVRRRPRTAAINPVLFPRRTRLPPSSGMRN